MIIMSMIDLVLDLLQSRGLNAAESDVRAIFQAIREPNEAMREAVELGQFFGGLDCSGYYEEAADHAWSAMIDAILKEGT